MVWLIMEFSRAIIMKPSEYVGQLARIEAEKEGVDLSLLEHDSELNEHEKMSIYMTYMIRGILKYLDQKDEKI